MDEDARFFFAKAMTSKFNKGYLTYELRVICNEFTIKENVRLCITRADVSGM